MTFFKLLILYISLMTCCFAEISEGEVLYSHGNVKVLRGKNSFEDLTGFSIKKGDKLYVAPDSFLIFKDPAETIFKVQGEAYINIKSFISLHSSGKFFGYTLLNLSRGFIQVDPIRIFTPPQIVEVQIDNAKTFASNNGSFIINRKNDSKMAFLKTLTGEVSFFDYQHDLFKAIPTNFEMILNEKGLPTHPKKYGLDQYLELSLEPTDKNFFSQLEKFNIISDIEFIKNYEKLEINKLPSFKEKYKKLHVQYKQTGRTPEKILDRGLSYTSQNNENNEDEVDSETIKAEQYCERYMRLNKTRLCYINKGKICSANEKFEYDFINTLDNLEYSVCTLESDGYQDALKNCERLLRNKNVLSCEVKETNCRSNEESDKTYEDKLNIKSWTSCLTLLNKVDIDKYCQSVYRQNPLASCLLHSEECEKSLRGYSTVKKVNITGTSGSFYVCSSVPSQVSQLETHCENLMRGKMGVSCFVSSFKCPSKTNTVKRISVNGVEGGVLVACSSLSSAWLQATQECVKTGPPKFKCKVSDKPCGGTHPVTHKSFKDNRLNKTFYVCLRN